MSKSYVMTIVTLKTGGTVAVGKTPLEEATPNQVAKEWREFLDKVSGWISFDPGADKNMQPFVYHKDNIAFISFPIHDFYEDPND